MILILLKFKKKKAVHSPEDSKSKNKIRKNQNVDPILIFSSASNKNLFDRSDFIKFDEKIQNISNAQVKFTKIDKNGNLLVFP